MRISGGSIKGQQLKVPKGGQVRPTTNLVRQALFSILQGMGADLSRVLDLFAGTGALGLEALSRGAEWVDFVEREPRCCSVIRDNLKKLGLEHSAHVYCCNAKQAMAFLKDKYGIVFLDPPYADSSSSTLLPHLAASGIIHETSLVAVSHSSRLPLAESYDRLRKVREQRYGDTQISIFHEEVAS